MKKKLPLLLLTVLLVSFGLLYISQGKYRMMAYGGLLSTPKQMTADIEQAYEKVLCSAVRIQGNGYYGSGSIFKMTANEMIIVTGRHVLTDFDEESYVTFFNGRMAKAKLLGISSEYDVGFLSVSCESFSEKELLYYRNVRIGEKEYDSIKKNDCFFMIDLATDVNNPVYCEGGVVDKEKYLEDYGVKMLYADGYAVGGMSGCGVFDERGNYIALLSGSTEQGELAAVPITAIMAEYEKIR